jgi:hypothetical protein
MVDKGLVSGIGYLSQICPHDDDLFRHRLLNFALIESSLLMGGGPGVYLISLHNQSRCSVTFPETLQEHSV